MGVGGESTQSARFVPGDHGFFKAANFQQLLAHFAVTLAVEQQQAQQRKQHRRAIGYVTPAMDTAAEPEKIAMKIVPMKTGK